MRFLLLLPFFSCTAAVNYFRFSVVITSSDLPQSTSLDIAFTQGNYRVYGTYYSGTDAEFSRNIHVTGNASVSLYSLSQSTPSSPYQTGQVMRAPIKVFNNNSVASTRSPFSIYIARVDEIRDMPVLDARTANGVQGTEVTIGEESSKRRSKRLVFFSAYGGLSILSAEPFYNLHSFTLPLCPHTSILFSSSGYDSRLMEYSLMRIPTFDYGPASFLTVSSPIATLYTETDSIFASCNYTLDKENRFGHHSLPVKSVVAISSPSWINSSQSFLYDFPITPFLNNSYTFAQKKTLSITITASDFLPNEKVVVQAGTQDDNTFESWSIDTTQKTSFISYGTTVKVTVTTVSSTHSPRFLMQITSGASELQSLLFCTVLSSVLAFM